MIAKILQSGYNDSGVFPAASVLPAFSGGFDRQTLQKRASIFEHEYDKFERKPDHTYIHLISVAAGEHYGPNSRADFYNGDSYRHDFPCPEKGGKSFVILDGGLNKYHNPTFMSEGGVYTEHYSSRDGAKPQGYIVAAKMNPDMHRGELIIGVRTSEWEDDIQKLSKGKPLKFSIGADVRKDICSICGHEAHTEDGHCEHYKNDRGAITEDGHQVYVISDNCVFHDISRVKTPAEKIAFSIKKIARADDFCVWQPAQVHHSSAKYMIKTATGVKRFETLSKLARIQKNIEAFAPAFAVNPELLAIMRKEKRTRKEASGVSGGEELCKFLNFVNEDQLFSGLKESKKILTPEEFMTIVIPKDMRKGGYGIDLEEVLKLIPGIFQKILHRDDVDMFCEDTTYQQDCTCPASIVAQLRKSPCGCLINEGDILRDLISCDSHDHDLTPSKRTVIIEISKPRSDVNQMIADDYASYVTSAAEHLSPVEMATMLLNYVL